MNGCFPSRSWHLFVLWFISWLMSTNVIARTKNHRHIWSLDLVFEFLEYVKSITRRDLYVYWCMFLHHIVYKGLIPFGIFSSLLWRHWLSWGCVGIRNILGTRPTSFFPNSRFHFDWTVFLHSIYDIHLDRTRLTPTANVEVASHLDVIHWLVQFAMSVD